MQMTVTSLKPTSDRFSSQERSSQCHFFCDCLITQRKIAERRFPYLSTVKVLPSLGRPQGAWPSIALMWKRRASERNGITVDAAACIQGWSADRWQTILPSEGS